MLHDIIVEKLVQEKYLSFVYNKTGIKKGGGSQILDWTYAKGGGGSLRCVLCATRGLGGTKIR